MVRRHSQLVCTLLLAVSVPAVPVAAPSPPPEATSAGDPLAGVTALDRDSLIRAVLDRNPGIEASRRAARAATARVPQARALADPMLAYGLAPLSVGGDVPFGQSLEVRQEIPFPGRRQARAAEAEAEAGAALAEHRAVRLELATAAALLWEDWALVERALAINRDHLRLLDEMKEVAAGRYAAGLAEQQDPLQAEAEAAELLAREAELEAERQAVAARLNALLHRPAGLPLPPPAARSGAPEPPESPEVTEIERAALAARPEIAARAAEIAARRAALDLARLERRPDLEVMGSYSSMWEDREHRLMVGVAVALPVRRARLEAVESEARERLAAAEGELARLTDEVRAEVRERHARLVQAERRVMVLADRLLPAARDRIEAARAGFETGRGGFLGVVEAERGLRRAELMLEEARADAARRRLELDRAAGRLPAGALQDPESAVHDLPSKNDTPQTSRESRP